MGLLVAAIFVDIDEVTMHRCSLKHDTQVLRCPLRHDVPWNPTAKLGILGDHES